MKGTKEKLSDKKILKWIFNKTKSQNINFILLNLINVIYSVLSIYLILISKNLIDSAVLSDFSSLKIYMIKLVIFSLVLIALKAILASIDAVTRAKLEVGFKQKVVNTILTRNYEKISKYHTGDLLTRTISDVDIIISTLVSIIPNMLSMLTKLVCAVVLLFNINKEFVFILLVGGIFLFLAVNIFKKYLKNIHKAIQSAAANVNLFFKEIFENLLVIKMFQAEKPILQKSREMQNKKYDLQMKRRTISIAGNTGVSTIFQGVYLYALAWSAYNLYCGNITVGGLTVIVQLIDQIQMPILGLSKTFQSIFTMLASAERIIELERIDIDQIDGEVNYGFMYDNLQSIVLNNVNFTYKNKKIFNNLNLEINKGETIAIYGESGVGKSTLLKLIIGIISKDNGDIYFKLNGNGVQDINSSTRNMFAYVPQGKFILSGTIRENLIFVNKNVTEEKLIESLVASDSMKFIENLPDGLDTIIGERGKGLSEGQLQRLAIARALVSDAPILILDEITSSLDSRTEEIVLNNIKNLKNRTCIIVTHRDSISNICDKEYVVENMNIRRRNEF